MSDRTLGHALDLIDKVGTYDTLGHERMDALDLVIETLRAYRPVIEAAKALALSFDPEFPEESRREVQDVCKAVEALGQRIATIS